MTQTFSRRASTLIGCTAAVGVASFGLVAAPASAASETPFISEIHYDNDGTDVGEFVEVQASAGADLTGWQVVLYNGNNGATYDTTTLSGSASTGDESGDGVLVVEYGTNGVQNGAPDGVALVSPGGEVEEFLSYEGAFTAEGGPADGMTSTDIGVSETSSTPVGYSLQRVAGPVWEGPEEETRGEVNAEPGSGSGPAPEPEPEPSTVTCDTAVTTSIPAVQGDGATSPLEGDDVVVRGVVTADLQEGLDGYTVQALEGDDDSATSDAVFVYDPDGVDVSVGDEVVVGGTVDEFFGSTQVGDVTGVAVCGTATLPEAAVLPFPSTDAEREPYEHMLVTTAEDLYVTGLYGLERFGEIRLGAGGVLVQGTEAAEPGQPALDYEALNELNEIVLDDARSGSNNEPLPWLSIEDSVRIGDVAVTGPVVLGYSFDEWRLLPASGDYDQVSFDPTVPRSPTAPDVGGDVTVAAFNVLNYFVTLTTEDSDARGARSEQQFVDQQAKIVNAINGLGADVVAVQEIEYGERFGKDADVALEALTDALNEALGEDVWSYVETPDYVRDTPDVIQNGIIYKTGSVTPVGDSLSGAEGADPEVWDNAREPVAQLFEAPDGDEFWVVSNHFKSKGCGDLTGAEPSVDPNADQLDGQGCFNADRTLQAASLAAFATDVLEPVDPDVLLMGDFNAYGMEDPITVLEAAGYVDVIEDLDVYTYRFDWRVGNLDHALLSPSAADKLTDADIWQVAAAESSAYDYFRNYGLYDPYPYRASDHNPVLVGLDTEADLDADVSLGDILLADTSGPETPRRANGDDYDILLALVQQVLEEKPDSAVGVLLDPTAELTAFLPNDDAFIATPLLPGRVRNEVAVANRLAGNFTADELEELLLGHVVVGQTLESTVVLASDGAELTTAAGTTLTVDVRSNGSVAVVDDAEGNRDALLVLDAVDINLGQVQIGHTVDRVLLP